MNESGRSVKAAARVLQARARRDPRRPRRERSRDRAACRRGWAAGSPATTGSARSRSTSARPSSCGCGSASAGPGRGDRRPLADYVLSDFEPAGRRRGARLAGRRRGRGARRRRARSGPAPVQLSALREPSSRRRESARTERKRPDGPRPRLRAALRPSDSRQPLALPVDPRATPLMTARLRLLAARSRARVLGRCSARPGARRPKARAPATALEAAAIFAQKPTAASAPDRGARAARRARRLTTRGACSASRTVWGGDSPQTGFDCSGLVRFVYAHFGFALPHSSYADFDLGVRVPRGNAAPGRPRLLRRRRACRHVRRRRVASSTRRTPVRTSRSRA